jgi:hypothetical protein
LRMGLNHSHSAANEIYTTFLHYIILNSRLWLKSQADRGANMTAVGAEKGAAARCSGCNAKAPVSCHRHQDRETVCIADI